MRRPKQTAVIFAGVEYDLIQEGSGTYTWYQICQVLHRDSNGTIDHYLRLRGYGLPHYKTDAIALLMEIAVNGPKEYKEPREPRKQKYVLDYHLAQVSLGWVTGKYYPYYVPPTTRRYYHIVEIDNPDALPKYQVRKEYWGIEMEGITWKDQFDRDKIVAIIKKLNEQYWRERKENLSQIRLEVDRRPWVARAEEKQRFSDKERKKKP